MHPRRPAALTSSSSCCRSCLVLHGCSSCFFGLPLCELLALSDGTCRCMGNRQSQVAECAAKIRYGLDMNLLPR